MKKLIVLMCLFTLSAHAEVVITGGFGTDGATGQSIPLPTSIEDAGKVFMALNLKADSRGKKSIELEDGSAIECEKPNRGSEYLGSGCSIVLRASQKGKLKRGIGLAGTVSFKGELAQKIYSALEVKSDTRVGATNKVVANLSCSKVVRPGAQASCTISNTNAIELDVEL